MPADDQWTVNGGDPRCSVEMTALAWQAGALLSVEIESESRRRARAAGAALTTAERRQVFGETGRSLFLRGGAARV